MDFDFRYDEHTNFVSKEGHYSQCKPHEATREEALLWHRVQELEKLLNEACPADVLALLDKAVTDPVEVTHFEMSANDFARVRQYAQHRVQMVTVPAYNQNGVFGKIPLMVDGSPTPVFLVVKRDAV